MGVDAALDDLPADLRGKRAAGAPHSAWQLLEHLRLAQRDILDFCLDPAYAEKKWPDDYWPRDPEPPSEAAWDESVAAFRRDRDAMKRLATDPNVDLLAKIPHGSGQTYLREVLLVIDHNAHHAGQLILLRRLLGAWPGSSEGVPSVSGSGTSGDQGAGSLAGSILKEGGDAFGTGEG